MNKTLIPILILVLAILSGCQQKKQQKVVTGQQFSKYVQAFTSGTIPRKSVISVYLKSPVAKPETYLKDVFQFSPAIKGETVLIGDRILEFRPAQPLQSNTSYTCAFMLETLVDVEPAFKKMEFEFSTIKQSYSITVEGLKNYEGITSSRMKLTGYLLTADAADNKNVEKMLSANYLDEDILIDWEHDPDQRKHYFRIDSISRQAESTALLKLTWNGKALAVDKSGDRTIEVPPLSSFKILDARVIQQPEQHLQIRFSDPLLKTQNLSGLVEMDQNVMLRLAIEGNVISAWPSKRINGSGNLTVHEGIRSVNHFRLKQPEDFLLQFSSEKPQVRLLGKGVIVPESKTMEIPFEAVSLNAVDVRVIQIFKDNVLQFFQNNRFNGSNDLKRVGRLVYSGKIDLTSSDPVDLNKWNSFRVNIADLAEIEQGAIYRVEIRFRKEYSLYEGTEKNKEIKIAEKDPAVEEPYETEWDSPGWYDDYYYPPGYEWEERDNPSHVSYYNYRRFINRNIFASELGIIAKEGRGHEMVFAVTNLVSAKPENGVVLELYNFQDQLIETVVTDNQGFARVSLKKKPFFLVANKKEQFGYLRLDDGSSLSISNFDVSGQEVQEGLKGFIYGERDVWRPGDTLFLNFILEQENDATVNHPAVFKLINPQGQVVENSVETQNENGFYSFITETDKDAPTGKWRAEVKVGNAVFSKRIRIETIKPNRLKIELDLPKNNIISKAEEELPVKASWLHGSPAKSLKTKIEVLFTKNNDGFKGFEKYSFSDPASYFSANEQTLFEGKLNKNGEATVPLNFEGLGNAPGMLNAWFTSRVFEEGGDFSTSFKKVSYAPFTTFAGIKMPATEDNWFKTDTEYHPEIVLVDANGEAVSGDDLQIKLYKIDWRWWWESGTENLAHYVSGRYYKPVSTWSVENAKHLTKIKLNVKYKNWEDNGRYLLWVKDLTSGHSSGLTFYMSKWGSWRSEGMAEGATLLTLRTDKEKYEVGEEIKVNIPSSKAGNALVSLENGTAVTDIFRVQTLDKQTEFSFKATAEMAPNFYVHVSLIQPYGQTENDAPLRLYGIIPVFVENRETILEPQIKSPSEIEPETKYNVEVSELNNKKMTYTLAVVDEGLLGLTNFQTPDPHKAFYGREALGVKTWDLYDYVAGAYGARLEKAFAIGGDGALNEKGKKEVNRFKPVVQFAGPFTLGKGEKGKHEFLMPNYIGAVRIMVIAGDQGAYGKAGVSVPVRKGLMLLATLPRLLAPQEEFVLPVNVFAMKEHVKDVQLTVKTNDLLEVVGSAKKSVQFSATGEKMSEFRLRVKGKTGVAKVEVTARSGKEYARYEVELEIRNPNSAVVAENDRFVKGEEIWESELIVPGDPSDAESWIEISGFPPLNLSKHLDYLIYYPHGCIEQITSAAFPQLFLDKLSDISAEQNQETEDNVRNALQKLIRYQLPEGGFAYWPGGSVVNEWGTSYAGHFMLNAEAAGFSLPYGLKESWLKYQQKASRNWNGSRSFKEGRYLRNYDLCQAYRLYTLALAGKPELGAMNRLREKSTRLAGTSWRLAAAYVLAGQKEAAQKLINGLSSEVEEYNEFSGTFGSALRDKALILESLILLDERENAYKMLQNISEDINNRSWLSTQSASWCLLAAAKYAERFYKEDKELRYELNVNGEKMKNRSTIPVIRIPVIPEANGKVKVQYKNTGDNSNFVRIASRGIPVGSDTVSTANDLVMQVKYLDSGNQTVNPAFLPQGTDFKMELTVKHPGKRVDYEEMVLTTVFPSGWEIINKRIGGIDPQNNNFEYQDFRDDRVYTYFDLKMNKQRTFVFHLNAAYKGKFYQPPVSCEAMYDFTVRAKKAGRWVEVTGN